jgi:E3 ubiquitin-protein ligase RAD18
MCRKKTSDEDEEDYPLPKASYGTLKDKQLKDMLREYGLPVTGDRSMWEQRHQQYVYNLTSLHFLF